MKTTPFCLSGKHVMHSSAILLTCSRYTATHLKCFMFRKDELYVIKRGGCQHSSSGDGSVKWRSQVLCHTWLANWCFNVHGLLSPLTKDQAWVWRLVFLEIPFLLSTGSACSDRILKVPQLHKGWKYVSGQTARRWTPRQIHKGSDGFNLRKKLMRMQGFLNQFHDSEKLRGLRDSECSMK